MNVSAASVPDYVVDVPELNLSVSRAELEARRDAVLAGMAEAGIDVAVITTPTSMFYLTGVQIPLILLPDHALVLDASGKHKWICRNIDRGWENVWAPQTWANDWLIWRDEEDFNEVVAGAIRAVHSGPIGKIGMELNRKSVSYDTVRAIAARSGAADVASITAIVEDLRVVKSDAELAIMRRAGEISKRAVDALIDAIRNGATDAEAAAAVVSVMLANGAASHDPAFPWVFTGPAGETGHIHWVGKAPKPGETVSFFVSGYLNMYANPIERTLVRAPDTSGVMDIVDKAVRAIDALIAAVRPGMTSAEAYQVVFDLYREDGIEKYWVNHAAYSAGINWGEFELFRLRPNDNRPLRAGMTFHVTPCLILPGQPIVVASRMIVVTESGGELLNDYPHKIPPLEF